MATLKDLFENENDQIYTLVEAFYDSAFSDLTNKLNNVIRTNSKNNNLFFAPVSITYNSDTEKYVALLTCYLHKPIDALLIGGEIDFDVIDKETLLSRIP